MENREPPSSYSKWPEDFRIARPFAGAIQINLQVITKTPFTSILTASAKAEPSIYKVIMLPR